jgi:SAM-dependent methyltransferase
LAESLSTTYDALWRDGWGELQDLGPVHRHVTRIIVDLVRELDVASVLDVGCGNGSLLDAIQGELRPRELTGIDISQDALARARQRVRGDFYCLDIEKETLDRQFELVLSSQVIEHIGDHEAFLRRLRELTSRYCLVGSVQGRMRPSESRIGHLRNYRRGELASLLWQAGFECERTIEWGFPFYSPLYRSLIELIGLGQTQPRFGRRQRFISNALYHLYRLNSLHRGDVVMVLGRVSRS